MANINPYVPKVFTPLEVLYWSAFTLIPTGLAIGAALTKQEPPVPVIAWVILVTAVLFMWGVAVGFFVQRWTWQKKIRFSLDPPGLTVAWTEEKYSVPAEVIYREVMETIEKMKTEFPGAEAALKGCVIWFREPVWQQDAPGPGYLTRKVAGTQDGQILMVGWRATLSETALKHELAHRILQMCNGDPPEVLAHHTMERLGVL